MAFIYEVNGVKVQFDKEPTDADIDEAAASLGSSKAKPKSNMPKPVEGEGGAAFGVYRPAGRRPESQQDREASADMPFQAARGVATGALGGIPDLLNLPGNIYGAATKQPSPYTVPLGSEEWNKMLPGQSDTPHAKFARTIGEMAAPIPTVSSVKALAKGVPAAIEGTVNAGKGFARGLAYPQGTSPDSALMPIRPTYVPQPQVDQFMRGEIPVNQLKEIPTAPLYENDPITNWGYGMAPESQMGQKLVPAAGKGIEGYAEQLGSTYRQQPLNLLADIGGTLLTGVPAPVTALRTAVPAYAAKRLQQATQFDPKFGPARAAAQAEEMAAMQAAKGRAGIESQMPTQPLLPAPGPVVPEANPVMYGSQNGAVGTDMNQVAQAAVEAKYPPMPKTGQTPKQVSMDLAASKIQPVAPTELPKQPVQQMPAQPAAQPAAIKPVAPTNTNIASLENQLSDLDTQSSLLHTENVGKATPGTPEGEQYQKQMNELYGKYKDVEKQLELAKQAEKDALRKTNKGKPKEDKQVPVDKNIKMMGAEGKINFTHSTPNRSKLYGTLNNGTKVEVHTTTTPVTVYDITNTKKPVKIAEFGGGGKQIFGEKLPD